MKRIVYEIIFSLILPLSSFALGNNLGEGDLMSKPHRYFEIGFDGDLSFANSSFGVQDFMKKNLVIDLQKISKEMPDDGFSLALNNREKFFININAGNHFRLSLFTEIEAASNFNIKKDLFTLLGEGIAVGDSIDCDLSGYGDLYANIGASLQKNIRGFEVKITPTYFVPVFYIPETTASASLSTSSSGAIRGEAEANIDIYTAVDMYDFMENGKSYDNLNFDTGDILSNGGFDLSLEVEKNFLESLNAGLYTRLPILPGTLKHKMSTRVWAYFYETNVLGYIDDSEDHDSDSGHDDFTYSDANYKVHRPFKLGLNATYKPFGKWLKIQPALGFAVRNPYSSDMIFYPEYALDFRFEFLWRILNFNVGTAYQNRIFQHRAGIDLNLRAIEIIAQASLCGTNLKASFEKDGYGIFVGMRVGL